MRGRLILIEGLDRLGKSTQAEILASKLNGHLVKFPDRLTKIGHLLNQYLTDPEFELPDESAHLLFSANRWEVAPEIRSRLAAGQHVILDRYVYSGVAYSLAKDSLNNADWLFAPDRGLPKPDITLFLLLSLQEISERKGWGEERYEKEAFQKKVKLCFLDILRPEDDASVQIVAVDGLLVDQTRVKIWESVQRLGCDTTTDAAVRAL